MKSIAFVGLDVHADTIVVHVLDGTSDTVVDERTLRNEETAVRKYFRRLSERLDLRCCYEASGCGYVLHRWLKALEIDCKVIAPSLVPVRKGDRVKTDKRDARKLARYLRSGELTAVRVPTREEEQVRSLVRCRETLVKEVVQSKNYVLKFLRLRGVEFTQGRNRWTQKHWAWLRSLEFDGADAFVWMEYLTLLDYKLLRLSDLDQQIEAVAQSDGYRQAVGKLCCFRGIGVQTAMVLLTETCDFARFGSPRQLMGYYGLKPTEDTSGPNRRQGPISKTGNSRCRRALVEAAWHFRHKPGAGAALKERQLGQPANVVAHAWKAQHRLHKKFWQIALRKERQKAVVATARELSGFVWAVMTDHFDGPKVRNSQVAAA